MTPVDVLLTAIADHLRDDVQPALGGFSAYQNRVATNLLQMLARDAREAPARAAMDARFLAPRGFTGDAPLAELARSLRDGDVSADDELLAFLRERSLRTLAIDNPRYSSLAKARKRWSDLAARVDGDGLHRHPDGFSAGTRGKPDA